MHRLAVGFANGGKSVLKRRNPVGGQQRLPVAGGVDGDHAVILDSPHQRMNCGGVDRRQVGGEHGDDVRAGRQRAQAGGKRR